MRASGLVVLVALAVTCGACTTTGTATQPFEVSRVTLFDCGIAQIEREAEINGAQELAIRLNLAHLDDLLATLVVATDNQVKVSGVRYPSVFNLGQARAASSFANAIGISEEERPSSLCSFVEALKGTAVELHTREGRTSQGVVLDCVKPAEVAAADGSAVSPLRGEQLVLVGQDGAFSWTELAEIVLMTPRSEREGQAIHDFARQLGNATGLAETEVRIATSAGSQGRLAAGYVRQIPVWRMSYKVSVTGDQATLEAWGLVHNDTDEDWQKIGMTLVSGLPTSFVMSLASPRYAQRESLYTDGGHNMYPQLGAATPDSLLYEEERLGYAYGAVGYGMGGGGHGYSSSSARGSSGVQSLLGTAGIAGVSDSSLLAVGASAAEEQADPRVEGEISTYRALEKVSVPARSASMVPLIRRAVPGNAFSLLESGAASTCVRVENDSGLVLQYGGASFYISGRFRGQSELERTEPGEVRVLCFGEDPDISYTDNTKVFTEVKAVEWRNGSLFSHSLQQIRKRYEVSNLAGEQRRAGVSVSHRRNGRIVSPEGTVAGEGSERYHLFTVPGRGTVSETVEVEEGTMTREEISAARLVQLLEHKGISAGARTVLEGALATLRKGQEARAEADRLNLEAGRLEALLERRRASLATVPPSSARSPVAEEMLRAVVATERSLEKALADAGKALEREEELFEEAEKQLSGLPAPKIERSDEE